jgi:hypothetical protein
VPAWRRLLHGQQQVVAGRQHRLERRQLEEQDRQSRLERDPGGHRTPRHGPAPLAQQPGEQEKSKVADQGLEELRASRAS